MSLVRCVLVSCRDVNLCQIESTEYPSSSCSHNHLVSWLWLRIVSWSLPSTSVFSFFYQFCSATAGRGPSPPASEIAAAPQVSIVWPTQPTNRLGMSLFVLAPARPIHFTPSLSASNSLEGQLRNCHDGRPYLLGWTCTAPSLLAPLPGPRP